MLGNSPDYQKWLIAQLSSVRHYSPNIREGAKMDGANRILASRSYWPAGVKNAFARLIELFNDIKRKVHPRSSLILALDLVLCAISLPAALLLRVSPGLEPFHHYMIEALRATPMFIGVAFVIFCMSGLYRAFWRFVALSDIVQIAKSAALAIIAFSVLLFFFNRLGAIPRSVPVIQYLILIALMTTSRVLYRAFVDRSNPIRRKAIWRVPAIVVGVNANTELFIRANRNNANAPF